MPNQPPRLRPHQFCDVGVLLLREHRAPCRIGVGEDREAELLGGPDDQLLAEPRQVDPEQRQVEQRLGDEVPVRHRVEGVLEPGSETEILGDGIRVERERGTCEGAGAERRHVEPCERVEQPVEVAGQRPAVSKQMMREKDGLGALEVRVPGKVCVLCLLRPASRTR